MHAPYNSASAANAAAGNPLVALARWVDSSLADGDRDEDRIDWLRVVPFIAMHLACLGVFRVGVSPLALWTALLLYALRMFALTGFYHRYFAHKAFRTSRPVQFVFALIGAACVQRGPLWWAAHHRDHHRHADTERDIHSPLRHGFLWSHMDWFLTPRAFRTRWEAIGDLQRYRELRWLDRYDIAVPVLLAVALFFLGRQIGAAFPGLDAALLPIGAYDPAWFMERQHLNPEQAVRAFQDLGARTLVGMHWGTFKLTDEPLDEPPRRLEAERQRLGLPPERVRVLAVGETLELSRAAASAGREAAAPEP